MLESNLGGLAVAWELVSGVPSVPALYYANTVVEINVLHPNVASRGRSAASLDTIGSHAAAIVGKRAGVEPFASP
jgi:hypothetical protein